MTDQFVIESKKTIESVQTSIETVLDEFEEGLENYLEQFRDQPDVLASCDIYALARLVYAAMPDYGVDVDLSIFV